jgi:hypothetical protein
LTCPDKLVLLIGGVDMVQKPRKKKRLDMATTLKHGVGALASVLTAAGVVVGGLRAGVAPSNELLVYGLYGGAAVEGATVGYLSNRPQTLSDVLGQTAVGAGGAAVAAPAFADTPPGYNIVAGLMPAFLLGKAAGHKVSKWWNSRATKPSH